MSHLEGSPSLPEDFRQRLGATIASGESVLAWCAPNLNPSLQFHGGLLVLTNQRLLHWDHLDEGLPPREPSQSWPLSSDLSLTVSDDTGAGRIQLTGSEGLLAEWHFTAHQKSPAHRLALAFDQWLRGDQVQPLGWLAEAASPEGGNSASEVSPAPVKIDKSLFRLARYAKPWTGMIVLGLCLALASTAAGLVPPYLTMPLLDDVLIPFQNGQRHDLYLVPWYIAGLAAAAVLAWLLSWARTAVLAKVSERLSAELRDQTYAHLQRLSLDYFGGRRTGDLIARVSNDTERICYFLSVHVVDFAGDVLLIVMTAIILVSIDPFLALATLGPLPLIAWLVHRVRQKLRGSFAVSSRAWGEMNSVLADTIPGIRVVKAFAQEQREIDRFHTANDHVLRANDRVNRTWSFFGPMVVLLTDVGLLVVWACGAYGIFTYRITVGVLTAFVAYISRFYSRLDSMSRMMAAVQRAAASSHRLFEILDQAPRVSEPERPIQPSNLQGAIEFRDVRFRYGHRPVVQGVNLSIQPGEMIGLVGPSGGGKSTLVNLVCRFYDVTDGAILIDGVDVRRFPVEAYRRNIGLVLQEPFLFFGTIAENIAYGRPDASRAEIVAAARAARAHEFIVRLTDGYDSLVGERGHLLSGGERQRISIARALLIDPKILILDEATSSVDTETEREIQLALENLTRGRTTIAIAHRLSTLRRADRLVVFQQGEIVDIGSHDELLQSSELYTRLHRAQQEMSEAQPV